MQSSATHWLPILQLLFLHSSTILRAKDSSHDWHTSMMLAYSTCNKQVLLKRVCMIPSALIKKKCAPGSQRASCWNSIEHAATDLTNSKSPRSTTVQDVYWAKAHVASLPKESFLHTFDPTSATQSLNLVTSYVIDSTASSIVSSVAFHDDVISAAKLASGPSTKRA